MIRFDASDSFFVLFSSRSVAAFLGREDAVIITGVVMGAVMGDAMGDALGDAMGDTMGAAMGNVMGIIMGIVSDSEASNEIGLPFEILEDIISS